MCGEGMHSTLLLPLVVRCLETIDECIWHIVCFYIRCSDSVGVCGNVCCVASVFGVFRDQARCQVIQGSCS